MRTLIALALASTPALAQDLTHEQALELVEQMEAGEVRLIDAGEGEARPLRYAPVVGARARYTMSQTLTMVQNVPPMPEQTIEIPAITYTFTSAVTSAPEDAPFTVSTLLDAVDVDDDNEPMMAAMIGPALQGLVGMTGVETVDRLGNVISIDTTLPDNAPDMARQQIEQVQSALTRVVFPQEPVAAGAVWHHLTEVDTGGFTISALYTYTLTALEGDTVSLDLNLHQIIPNQALDADALPPGATARITGAKGSATATMRLDLVDATTSEYEMNSELSMNVNVAMQQGAMETATTQNVKASLTITPLP